MKIADEILNPYWIEVDNLNHKVQIEIMTKDMKFRVETIGYYNSVGSAVNKIAKLKVLDANPDHPITLKQYVEELKQIQETFLKTID